MGTLAWGGQGLSGAAASAGRRCRRSGCGLEEGLSQMGKIYCLGAFLGVLSQMVRIPGVLGWCDGSPRLLLRRITGIQVKLLLRCLTSEDVLAESGQGRVK